MERLLRIAKRMAGVLVFALVCFAALLYGMGRFDFVFIKRDLPISGMGSAVIETPEMSDDDKELQDHVGNLNVGENLSGISSGTVIGGDKEGDETAETDENGDEKVPAPEEYYPTLDQALALGYTVSSEEYVSDGDHVLTELLLDIVMTKDQIKGQKDVIVDAPVVYEDGGEYFYATKLAQDYRFSFEVYMGYILVSDKTTVSIFDMTGNSIGVYGHSEMSPAYVCDMDGNPLFTDGGDAYFYLDGSGRKMYSSYTDSDSIGLYFNYRKELGKSDNPLEIFYRNEDVYFLDEIDTSDYYIRSSVDPSLAYYIYLMRPSYAETVARSNPRFAVELAKVKTRIEEEKRLEEEKKTEQLTADTETLEIPDSDTLPLESDTLPIESDTLTIGSDTAAQTSDDTFEITSEQENETNIPETEIETEIETETETEIETELPEETAKAPATSSNPNVLVIERTLDLVRYGYGYANADRDSIDYKYAKAYGFSEGRAAVVDDDGVLRFINPMGEVVIDGTGTKMVTASRYITTEYAEPLYRHSENSKGYLYFDSGLVRVRRLERDYTFRNLIYSDSDVLLYADGSEFPIPHGYTLVAYSEGVLVLKGQNGKYGYYHKDGYWIAQPVYTEIRPFSEGLGVIGFLGGRKCVIDKNGNIVVPFNYEYITAPSDGVMVMYSYENGWKIIVKAAKSEA